MKFIHSGGWIVILPFLTILYYVSVLTINRSFCRWSLFTVYQWYMYLIHIWYIHIYTLQHQLKLKSDMSIRILYYISSSYTKILYKYYIDACLLMVFDKHFLTTIDPNVARWKIDKWFAVPTLSCVLFIIRFYF